MASTAEELSSQSEQLQNTIGFFRVDNREAPRRAAARQSRPAFGEASRHGSSGKVLNLAPVRKANGYHAPAAGFATAGLDLDMSGAGDKLDTSFEKF
jgi:methyl-accepting chemotaxis protein